MISSWIIQVGSKSRDNCPYKIDTETQRGEGHVTTGTEIGGMQPQAGESLKPPDAGRGRKPSPREPPEGTRLCPHLDFRRLASRTVKE